MKTVQQLYAAFAEGDADRLQQILADTHWIEAEGMPYGGTYRGFGEIAANVFGPITHDVQGFTAKPDEIVPVAEDRVWHWELIVAADQPGKSRRRSPISGRSATAEQRTSSNMRIPTSFETPSEPEGLSSADVCFGSKADSNGTMRAQGS